MKAVFFSCIGSLLAIITPAFGQGAGFQISSIGTNGIIKVQATDTYYDGNNGTLFAAVPLPAGANHLQFRATGGVITDGSDRLASADGLYSNLQTPYNWNSTAFHGTYLNTSIGTTTGIDPALFGIFFNPAYSGLAPNSANYRSDTGIIPDPRTLLTYAPQLNQPVYIGDGYTTNNPYVTNVDSYLPAGSIQTYTIPPGATKLLLGVGADPDMSDNVNPSDTNSAFLVHVFDDSASRPIIDSISGSGAVALPGLTASFTVNLSAGASPLSYQWSYHGSNLVDTAHVSGSQSNVLTLTNLQLADSGVYQVVVSNAFGTATVNATVSVYSTGQLSSISGLTVPGNAEIHGAGNAGLPDPSGGVNPVLVNLPANSLALYVSNLSGTISLNGNGEHSDADGGLLSGGGYPSSSYSGPYGGISGIRLINAGALVGVFEPASAPSGTAPNTLDFTVLGENFNSLAPALYQTFFIGDGLTGDGSGTVQQFLIPPGATRLFLGIPDAPAYNGSPGGYGDNSGSFSLSLNVLAANPIPVTLTNLQKSGTNFSFAFQTVGSQSYTVEQSTNLLSGTWTYYTNVNGDGSLFKLAVPVSPNRTRFFRVQEP